MRIEAEPMEITGDLDSVMSQLAPGYQKKARSQLRAIFSDTGLDETKISKIRVRRASSNRIHVRITEKL